MHPRKGGAVPGRPLRSQLPTPRPCPPAASFPRRGLEWGVPWNTGPRGKEAVPSGCWMCLPPPESPCPSRLWREDNCERIK